jgi:uncharacterized protein (DUF305 family)
MTPTHTRGIAAALLVAAAGVACSRATQGTARTSPPSPSPQPATGSRSDAGSIAKAKADSARHPYTAADVQFMQGMISHHAQAIVMADWSPTHGASPSVRTLSERIINAQQDEIATMQQWLRDRQQEVPAADPKGMAMTMNGGGGEQHMLMPGMLTEAQMSQLDQATGTEFDRLFLTFMIQHHRGAVSMVQDLFATYGAGQDETVFKFASDVNVDQSTEIARMEKMLFVTSLGRPSQ